MSHGSRDSDCIFRMVLEKTQQMREKDETEMTSGKETQTINNTAGCFTEFTPPDWYSEHMALRGASPIVVPWNDKPLKES